MKITVIKKQSKMHHINKGFGYDNFFDIGCSLNLNKSMFDNVDKEQEQCEDMKNEEYSNGHSTILTIARYPLCNYDNVITIDEQCTLNQLISTIKSNLPTLCSDYIQSSIIVSNEKHKQIFYLIVNPAIGAALYALYDELYYINDAKWEEIKRDKFKIKPNKVADKSECIDKLAARALKSYNDFMMKNWVDTMMKVNDKCDTDVLKFIYQFKQRGNIGSTDNIIHDVFRHGYCWHFAHILKSTFGRGEVCIAYPFGHFVWKDVNGVVYDIEGEYGHDSEACCYIPEDYLPDEVLDTFRHIPDCDEHYTTKEEIEAIEKRYVHDRCKKVK